MDVLLVLAGSVLALLVLLVSGDRRTGGGVRQALGRTASEPAPSVVSAGAPIVGPSIACPVITGAAPDGSPLSIDLTQHPTSTLLVFLGSTCVTCDGLWRDADRFARRTRRHLRIVVVTRGPGAESTRLVAAKAPRSVPVVMSDEVWTAYGVGAAPAFAIIDGATGIATPLEVPATWADIVTATRSTS